LSEGESCFGRASGEGEGGGNAEGGGLTEEGEFFLRSWGWPEEVWDFSRKKRGCPKRVKKSFSKRRNRLFRKGKGS